MDTFKRTPSGEYFKKHREKNPLKSSINMELNKYKNYINVNSKYLLWFIL